MSTRQTNTVHIKWVLAIMTALALTGCASTNRLSKTPPPNSALQGEWVLNASVSDTIAFNYKPVSDERTRSRSNRGKERGGGKNRTDKPRKNSDSGASSQQRLKMVATMTTTSMKIEQDSMGLGITFPKSPYRDIDLGKFETRNATITAGWNKEDQFVVISKTDKQSFTETYVLNESGNVLTIKFEIDGRSGKKDYVRVFDRKT